MKVFGLIALAIGALGIPGLAGVGKAQAQPRPGPAEPGQLTILGKDGKPSALCPLERTSVHANVSGFASEVKVVQRFANPSRETIEAVYTFPLPSDAAVNRMRIKVGSRIIDGQIKRREEARRIYDLAKSQGQTAALLDQERPNIFTQSVANITAGSSVEVEITYVQTLKFESGQYEFNFPMVVGPRFLGNAQDPGKIAPPITPKGTRTGTNIDLTIDLDAGAPIRDWKSILHDVDVKQVGPNRAQIKLKHAEEIPNRDFIFRYRVATDQIQPMFLTHVDPDKGGFFSLVLLPPRTPIASQVAPKEVIFVIDQSGSQSGFPIEKSKELTLRLINSLRPGDSFNVLGFSNNVDYLWKSPRPATPQNILAAERFVKPIQANGGTQLRTAVEAAYAQPEDPSKVRLVVFNTDGYVGDEKEILDTIQRKNGNSRIFTFGIGNGVNRFLIDSMSAEGKGDSEVVTLAESAEPAVARFLKRTESPLLTNVVATFEGQAVTDVLPTAIPDVFDGRPVIIHGRYTGGGPGKLILTGKLGGKPWSQTVELEFPTAATAPAVMSLWARQQVDQLTRQNWLGSISGDAKSPTKEAITDIALEYSIMSEFTSFVAVESRVVNIGGRQRTVAVPIEMADGVSYEMGGNLPGRTASQLIGSGGFGGGGGGGGRAASTLAYPTAPAPTAAKVARMDADDAPRQLTPEEQRKRNVESKVAASLRKAIGKVDVQIWVASISDSDWKELERKLRALGFTWDVVDRKLRLVMGVVEAVRLADVAQIASIERIERLP